MPPGYPAARLSCLLRRDVTPTFLMMLMRSARDEVEANAQHPPLQQQPLHTKSACMLLTSCRQHQQNSSTRNSPVLRNVLVAGGAAEVGSVDIPPLQAEERLSAQDRFLAITTCML
jgi:hypothetical protein